MPIGHGTTDYVVVVLVLLWSAWILANKPHRMLIWLPLFLTIDFFIPIVTQLTPARILPFMLAAWLLLTNRIAPPRSYQPLLIIYVVIVTLSLAYSLIVGDAGIRPILRSLTYFSLLFVFLFVTQMVRSIEALEHAILGLFVAGVVHGGHALYQQFASIVGLPYRGIIYSASGTTVEVQAGGFLRVNGFADEPKRLGYILLCGALAAFYILAIRHRAYLLRSAGQLAVCLRSRATLKWCIVALLSISAMTFAGSYLAALVIVVAIQLTVFSKRMYAVVPLCLVLTALLFFVRPGFVENYINTLSGLVEDRVEEITSGLEADNIYRQELFAEHVVQNNLSSMVFGVGIGRYNRVLYDTFGPGAGYSFDGGVLPLNSQLFEIGFDIGLVGIGLMYILGGVTFLRISQLHPIGFTLAFALIFIVVQSLFIDTKFYFALVLSFSLAWLRIKSRKNCNQILRGRRVRL